MASTNDQKAEVRRMCALADDDATYTGTLVGTIIEGYPLPDQNGTMPTYLNYSTNPPTVTENEAWIPTYDLNAAAAKIWGEKAAALAAEFDFETNDQRFDRSQKHLQALRMQRLYASRRAPTSVTVYGQAYKGTDQPVWIGNLPEPDDD